VQPSRETCIHSSPSETCTTGASESRGPTRARSDGTGSAPNPENLSA
jgi:hypothetical protein